MAIQKGKRRRNFKDAYRKIKRHFQSFPDITRVEIIEYFEEAPAFAEGSLKVEQVGTSRAILNYYTGFGRVRFQLWAKDIEMLTRAIEKVGFYFEPAKVSQLILSL